jgi:hypothetical protein
MKTSVGSLNPITKSNSCDVQFNPQSSGGLRGFFSWSKPTVDQFKGKLIVSKSIILFSFMIIVVFFFFFSSSSSSSIYLIGFNCCFAGAIYAQTEADYKIRLDDPSSHHQYPEARKIKDIEGNWMEYVQLGSER